MKDRAIIFVYGEGGHKAQMNRLLQLIQPECMSGFEYLGICENDNSLPRLKTNYSFPPLRDKYSHLKSVYRFPFSFYLYLKLLIKLHLNYNIQAVVSTGPGIAVVVSVFCKLLRKKVVYIETWSRFETRSHTGWIMYKLADRFYIQNKSLQKYYPNAIYSGLL